MRLLVLGMEDVRDRPSGPNRYVDELAKSMAGNATVTVVSAATAIGKGSDRFFGSTGGTISRLRGYRRSIVEADRHTDVVNSHFALYGFSALLTPLRRRPMVTHFHGPWALEAEVAGDTSRLSLATKRFIETLVYSRSTRLITLSQSFKRLLVERYSVSPWKVAVIPPGVSLDRFQPGDSREARRRLGLSDVQFVAVCVRRLTPRTGIGTLLDAWQGTSVRADSVLLIAGDGPERSRLEQQSIRLGLSGSVRFLGRVDDDALVDLYQAANVTVLPSVALEGFGLAALESLAAGTPVIAFEVDGVPELLDDLDRSLLVKPGDVAALSARISRAVGSGELPSRQLCRQHAERYSWTRAAKSLGETFRMALRSPSDRRARLVIVDHCAVLSGAELQLLQLLPALAESVDIHVILGDDGPLRSALERLGVSTEVLPFDEDAARVRRATVQLHRLPLRAAGRSALYAFRLAKRLRSLEPDIVQTNSLKAHLLGSLACRWVRTPLIWHLHDRIAPDYLPKFAVRSVRWASRAASAIVANSSATAQTVARRGFDVDVVPYGIAPKFLRPPRDGRLLGSAARFVLVGRIQPWKGQHVFLEAFARAFPSSSEAAVIVGAPLFGERDYEQELHALSVRLGIEGRVTFTGFDLDVEKQLDQADCLVHASTIPEPFGQVIVEGMSAGIPVIATATGGPAELIVDGLNGLLVSPGDVGALADAMIRISRDPVLRRRLSDGGHHTARRFGPEVVAGQMLHVYRRVLAARQLSGVTIGGS